MLMALAQEFDDRPGPVRDLLVEKMSAWQETIARVVRAAIDEKQFRENVDPQQFAYEMMGIAMAFHHSNKLLKDPQAKRLARASFEQLIARSRSSRRDDIQRKASRKAA